MFYDLFVQALALVFLLFFILSYYAKTRIKILLLQLFGFLFLMLHFLLLHAWSGFAVQLINIFSTILFMFKGKKKFLDNNVILVSFLLLYFILTLFTWEGFYSIFAFFAISIGTFARWQIKPNTIRFTLVFATLFWIIYDFFVGSYGGIISEIVLLVFLFISLIRNIDFKSKNMFR